LQEMDLAQRDHQYIMVDTTELFVELINQIETIIVVEVAEVQLELVQMVDIILEAQEDQPGQIQIIMLDIRQVLVAEATEMLTMEDMETKVHILVHIMDMVEEEHLETTLVLKEEELVELL